MIIEIRITLIMHYKYEVSQKILFYKYRVSQKNPIL